MAGNDYWLSLDTIDQPRNLKVVEVCHISQELCKCGRIPIFVSSLTRSRGEHFWQGPSHRQAFAMQVRDADSPPVGIATTEYFYPSGRQLRFLTGCSHYVRSHGEAFLRSMAPRSSPSLNLRSHFRRNDAFKPVDSYLNAYADDLCKQPRYSHSREPALPTPEVLQRVCSYHRCRNMRIVSGDDELLQRAANPRTGVITPFLTGSEDLNIDYLSAGTNTPKASPLIRIARKAVGSGPKSRKRELPKLPSDLTVDPDRDPVLKPSTSIRLSQYLPRLEFLHPSHFANLERSYRRPADLLPREKHNALNKRTVSSTSPPSNKVPPRQHMQRQNGNVGVPQARTRVADRSFFKDPQGIRDIRAKTRPSQACSCIRCRGTEPSTEQEQPKMDQCPDGSADQVKEGVGLNDSTDPNIGGLKPPIPRDGQVKISVFTHLPRTGWIQQRLVEMIGHVCLTLHHASPAVQVLRSPEIARIDEYVRAAKSVFLAALYLLVLLNILALAARAFRSLLTIIAMVGWPVRMLWFVSSWVLRG